MQLMVLSNLDSSSIIITGSCSHSSSCCLLSLSYFEASTQSPPPRSQLLIEVIKNQWSPVEELRTEGHRSTRLQTGIL